MRNLCIKVWQEIFTSIRVGYIIGGFCCTEEKLRFVRVANARGGGGLRKEIKDKKSGGINFKRNLCIF